VLDGKPFPFETSSELYPEYGLLAGEHVEWEIQREILQSLLALRTEDYVCDPIYCNVAANGTWVNPQRDDPHVQRYLTMVKGNYDDWVKNPQTMVGGCKAEGENNTCCVKVLCNAEIASFQAALSYGPARDLYQTLGLMKLDPVKRRWRCVRAEETWDGISCPAGMFKLSRTEVASGCKDQGQTCDPDRYSTCLCRPCKRANEVDILPMDEVDAAQRRTQLLNSSALYDTSLVLDLGPLRRQSSVSAGCSKMSLCGKIRQKQTLILKLVDNKLREKMAVTWTLRERTEARSGSGQALDGAFDSKYMLSLTSKYTGVHILQILLDGVEVPSSPVLIEVVAADCEDSTKIADEQGECRCNTDAGYTSVAGSKCMKLSVLVVVIVVPLFCFLILAGIFYIKFTTKMADSIWEIKIDDLVFDNPIEVLGRGTFGLVVSANYNTTRVAVKRVIPVRIGSTTKRRGFGLFMGVNSGGVGKRKMNDMFAIRDDDALSGILLPHAPPAAPTTIILLLLALYHLNLYHLNLWGRTQKFGSCKCVIVVLSYLSCSSSCLSLLLPACYCSYLSRL
jgi:hypothetical protein